MPLIEQLTEVAIRAELDHHLSSTEEPDKVVGTLIFIQQPLNSFTSPRLAAGMARLNRSRIRSFFSHCSGSKYPSERILYNPN
jgi:hypothetical protein